MTKHIIGFSGGKDSTALLCWAKENLPEFTAVFCDTGWEHPVTYAYVEEVNRQLLGGSLLVLKSKKYEGFADLVKRRGIVPGIFSRFCTQELKVFPLHDYFETLDEEVVSYQGIRADESKARAAMPQEQWVDDAGGYTIKRPLFHWTAEQCFALAKKHGIKPNPLYLMGVKRVGCWPCIMVNKRELKALFTRTPGLLERLVELETALNEGREEKDYRTFFRTDFLPERFCSLRIVTKDGRIVAACSATDVFRYLQTRTYKELEALDEPARSCVSWYNLCE